MCFCGQKSSFAVFVRWKYLEAGRPVSPAAGKNVAGSYTGTEAGAPPITLRGIQLEGHRPRCPRVRMFRVFYVPGRDKPARPPALQVRLSRGRWRAGGRRYKCDVALNWRGTGPPGTIGSSPLYPGPARLTARHDWCICHWRSPLFPITLGSHSAITIRSFTDLTC